MLNTKIIARPWQPQDLIDDLQGIIDEECDNYLNTRRTTLCMARDYLKEHFAEDNNVPSKWIPVTERLPENDQKALCIMQYDGEFRVLRWNYIDYMWNTGIEWFREKDVTHWMPLPEPPKGE